MTGSLALPDPVIQREGRFLVLRDDLIHGGTKVRVLLDLLVLSSHREVVYAAHPFGYGALALAEACRRLDKRLTLFFPHFSGRPKPWLLASKQAHVTPVEVRGAATQVEAAPHAAFYAADQRALFLPVGFDTEAFHRGLVRLAGRLPVKPAEVWAVAGSGCLCRALHTAWPQAQIKAVSLGFEHVRLPESIEVFRALESPEDPAQDPPPYPSATYYDAKLWHWVELKASDDALVWNVA